MKRSAFSPIITAICFVMLITIVSCTNTSKEADSTKTVSTDSVEQAKQSTDTSVLGARLSKPLYVLWIETDSLKNLNGNRVLLKYYVEGLDSLTLHGWSGVGLIANQFDEDPAIKLKIGRLSDGPIEIIKGIYLGNVVIKGGIVDKIKKKASKFKYLVLSPEKDGASIKYDLKLTDNDPRLPGAKFLDGIDFGFANPTPPRNYDGSAAAEIRAVKKRP